MALGLFSSHVYNTHDEIRLKIRLLGRLHQASDTIMDSLPVLYLRKGHVQSQWCAMVCNGAQLLHSSQFYGFEDPPILTPFPSGLVASIMFHRVTWNPEMPSDFISEYHGHSRVPFACDAELDNTQCPNNGTLVIQCGLISVNKIYIYIAFFRSRLVYFMTTSIVSRRTIDTSPARLHQCKLWRNTVVNVLVTWVCRGNLCRSVVCLQAPSAMPPSVHWRAWLHC